MPGVEVVFPTWNNPRAVVVLISGTFTLAFLSSVLLRRFSTIVWLGCPGVESFVLVGGDVVLCAGILSRELRTWVAILAPRVLGILWSRRLIALLNPWVLRIRSGLGRTFTRRLRLGTILNPWVLGIRVVLRGLRLIALLDPWVLGIRVVLRGLRLSPWVLRSRALRSLRLSPWVLGNRVTLRRRWTPWVLGSRVTLRRCLTPWVLGSRVLLRRCLTLGRETWLNPWLLGRSLTLGREAWLDLTFLLLLL